MKLALPNITLLMLETRCHQLARLAIEDCLNVADFGDIVVMSNQFNELRTPGATHVRVEDWPDKVGYCRSLWHDAPTYVHTTHALIIQWDSWITFPELWNKVFLEYDYIGSTWDYGDGFDVGNSGFSLRSSRMMDYLSDNRAQYPVLDALEDDLLCRRYRANLEMETGFHWAPNHVADRFSFEHNRKYEKTFGFHGIFNFPLVLDRDRLNERLKLAARNPLLQKNKMLETVQPYIVAAGLQEAA